MYIYSNETINFCVIYILVTGAGSANITEEHFQKYLKRLINIFSPRLNEILLTSKKQ